MDIDMKTLVSERAQVKAALTRLNKFYEGVNDSTSVDLVEARLDKNLDLLDKFDRTQNKIEFLINPEDEDEVAKNEEERIRFESIYYTLVAKLKRFIKDAQTSISTGANPAVPQSSGTPGISEAPVAIKLPMISLPSFSGGWDQWVRFRESFESLIHNNDSISTINKFHYLNSSISGAAARVIHTLGISEANYLAAWQALRKRYEDPNALIDHHTRALFDLPGISKPSYDAIRQLVDDATNHLAALKTLGERVEHWGTMLLQLIVSKLDHATKGEWKKHAQTLMRKRKFEDLLGFLEQHSRLLEESVSDSRSHQSKPAFSNLHQANKRSQPSTSLVVNLESCPLCKGNHRLADCHDFIKLPVPARRTKALKFRVCFNCLQPGHMNKDCTRSLCRKCGKTHHTLVHMDSNKSNTNEQPADRTSPAQSEEVPVALRQSFLSHSSSAHGHPVLLSTAMVNILDSQGRVHQCRALLDQGSQANFISKALCEKLNLRENPVSTSVSGIGQTSRIISGRVNVDLSSRVNKYKTALPCLVISKISDNIPNFTFNSASIPIPKTFILADPQYAISRKVDILIGNGRLWDLICVGQHRLGKGLPVMQKTQLGWILAGEMDLPMVQRKQGVQCHVVTNNDLNHKLELFWEVEEIPNSSSGILPVDASDFCERHFKETTTRDLTGRYLVSIPFTNQLGELGDSRHIAEKRLLSIERKFDREPELKVEYMKFMSDYLRLGHMREISSERILNGEPSFYLPHHAVFKSTSTTTKLRVVFDGSAKSTSGVSLNQVQHVGPTVQDDLFSIVLRFRAHKYVLSADVAKMYRQVLIVPEQRRYQRILFRFNSSEPMKTYELGTVTYGTASASFLATRALRTIGEEHLDNFPMAGRAIIRDFYVDDLLTGSNTLDEARALRSDITSILATAGFELRKWATNDPRIIKASDPACDPNTSVAIDSDKDPKTLGLLWDTEEDCLRYSVQPATQQRITKRSILSEIARIFDPLGLVGPAIIQAKMIMQELWQLKTSWDESLSLHLHSSWKIFRQELTSLNDLRILRPIRGNDSQHAQLHGFCDASEKAYGASVYLRSQDSQGNNFCRLLCAKSRVAPLKTISIPRLELCGALLLSKLMTKIRSALGLPIEEEYCWTDSTIVLAWISGSPSRWKTFVANRTSEIQQHTKGHWRHVPSEDNPADLISRGVNPTVLATASIWWHGPSWLLQQSIHWPDSRIQIDHPPEERLSACAMIGTTTVNSFLFQRYSCANRLIRIVAYCLRFLRLLRSRKANRNLVSTDSKAMTPLASPVSHSISLSVDEINQAETTLIKLAQKESFAAELTSLSKGQDFPKTSRLLSLAPFLDKVGALRVGGRLCNAPISYDQRHPLILQAKHPLTLLIIRREHLRLLHAGCHAVLASIRNKYWPISGKNTIKGVLRACVKCFRVKPVGTNYIMGQLPADRVTPSRPFSICGIDYAGPFYIKEKNRSRVTIKSYLCVFVCFSTKAVHLELATDMSTDAFLNCLKRFIARRGLCIRLYSDNGSNFIGARNELHELGVLLSNKAHNARIIKVLASDQIQWHLIPPGSPNFGGIWESAVKSAKYHVKRVVGETRLTFEELYTILTQIESCLNSRPLCSISNDPEDFTSLTPGHFLIGTALTALPHPDLREIKLNRLNRFQLLQQMMQHFWARWHNEYLHQLQQRHKWRSNFPNNFGPGTLVVIREDNTPPLRWPMGRITELHPGKDHVTRVVSIRTSSGIIKRPVSKICILPCGDQISG